MTYNGRLSVRFFRAAVFSTLMSPTSIVAYLTLFIAVGFLALFAALLIGRLIRPRVPTAIKGETYECGEPSIGTSYVQFDLRFYVVALIFIIFDVEVAFFFPWATVFGTATTMMDPHTAQVEVVEGQLALSPAAERAYREFGVSAPRVPMPEGTAEENSEQVRATGQRLALASMADIGVFFAVLLVGFAYVWRLGDLDWVRARSREPESVDSLAPSSQEQG